MEQGSQQTRYRNPLAGPRKIFPLARRFQSPDRHNILLISLTPQSAAALRVGSVQLSEEKMRAAVLDSRRTKFAWSKADSTAAVRNYLTVSGDKYRYPTAAGRMFGALRDRVQRQARYCGENIKRIILTAV
jgi:hypothetical protein